MKKFYTDKDIEELFHSGVRSLAVTDDVVLTDLAFEKARTLGMLLDDSPPAAPVRPYLSDVKPRHSTVKPFDQTQDKVDSGSSASSQSTLTPSPSPREALPQGAKGERGDALEKRIRERVAEKLGNQVDASLLDTIIKRTLKVVRLK